MPRKPDQGRRVPDPADALLTKRELFDILRGADKYGTTRMLADAHLIHEAQREKFERMCPWYRPSSSSC